MESALNLTNRKNLIFDLDGTLIDSSAGVISSTNYALEKIGDKPRGPDEIRQFIGYPLESMFNRFSDKSYDDFWHYFQEKAREAIVESTIPIDRAGETLRKLHDDGYQLGIGTTKVKIHIKKILNKLNWEKYISVYVGADDVRNVKPAPETFIKAMLLMGADKTNSIVIGDTVNDIIAARAAGVFSIALKSIFGGNDKLCESNPDYFINKIYELPDLLRKGSGHAQS